MWCESRVDIGAFEMPPKSDVIFRHAVLFALGIATGPHSASRMMVLNSSRLTAGVLVVTVPSKKLRRSWAASLAYRGSSSLKRCRPPGRRDGKTSTPPFASSFAADSDIDETAYTGEREATCDRFRHMS